MENNYFTPSIEDIRVGYEYESLRWKLPPEPKYWEKMIWGESRMMNSFDMAYFRELCAKGEIRVPYLTKEQIEAEGWAEIKEECWMKGMLKKVKENGHTFYCIIRKNNNLYVSQYIPSKPDEVWSMSMKSTVYDGECRDINTFRYICKLLGI